MEANAEAETCEARCGRVTDASQISSDNSARLLTLSPTKGQGDQSQHNKAAADQMMLLCASPSQEVCAASVAGLGQLVVVHTPSAPVCVS